MDNLKIILDKKLINNEKHLINEILSYLPNHDFCEICKHFRSLHSYEYVDSNNFVIAEKWICNHCRWNLKFYDYETLH